MFTGISGGVIMVKLYNNDTRDSFLERFVDSELPDADESVVVADSVAREIEELGDYNYYNYEDE